MTQFNVLVIIIITFIKSNIADKQPLTHLLKLTLFILIVSLVLYVFIKLKNKTII